MDIQSPLNAQEPNLCVLKFGSSVLAAENDYSAAAQEVYRHVRAGEKVLAVVSALAGKTDALLDQAAQVGGPAPSQALLARIARVGELHSAALMALALDRLGVRACTMDPHELDLVAEGEPTDSYLRDMNAAAVREKLGSHDVIVVPGFTAGHAEHGVVTLGRGGTDLSAVFLAARLGAHRARLIKDVDGAYSDDPAVDPDAQRFAELSYDQAAEASSGLIQPKAILAARDEGVTIEIASLGTSEGTIISNRPARKSAAGHDRRLRVALLGCGSVGAGVLSHLRERPDLFEVNPVLVREPERRDREGSFTNRVGEAMADAPDLVVELIGGADFAAEIMCSALRSGARVVTANKAAVAKHYDALHACADASGAAIVFSAAVGGGAPVLERLAAIRDRIGVVAIEGVMNGTANFLLSRLAEGWAFDAATKQAQIMGFAEADPTADVDGHDAADKLSLLIRQAFGVAVSPEAIAKQSLRTVSPELAQAAQARGEVLKQIGRCRLLPSGRIEAEIRVESLLADHPLAGARNEENRFLITDSDGDVHAIYGKGAGRWPTAASVFADIMDVQRALKGYGVRVASRAAAPQLRLSA